MNKASLKSREVVMLKNFRLTNALIARIFSLLNHNDKDYSLYSQVLDAWHVEKFELEELSLSISLRSNELDDFAIEKRFFNTNLFFLMIERQKGNLWLFDFINPHLHEIVSELQGEEFSTSSCRDYSHLRLMPLEKLDTLWKNNAN